MGDVFKNITNSVIVTGKGKVVEEPGGRKVIYLRELGISDDSTMQLIDALKKLPGAISYDGDVSVQVAFPLRDGNLFRIGITDDDVAETQGGWADTFEGLKIVGGDPKIPLSLKEIMDELMRVANNNIERARISKMNVIGYHFIPYERDHAFWLGRKDAIGEITKYLERRGLLSDTTLEADVDAMTKIVEGQSPGSA